MGVAVSAVAGALVSLVIAAGVSMLAADHSYLVARMQVRGVAGGDPARSTERAIELSPLDITYLRHLPLVDETPSSERRIAAIRRALAVEPDDLESVLMLLEAARTVDDVATQRGALAHAQAIAPNNPRVIAAADARQEQ